MLHLSVIDTGIGIAPENQGKLFQAFVQIDSKLSRQYEGTGLGLALVKRITELHGGQVTVTSEAGHGSCFTVQLPPSSWSLPEFPQQSPKTLSANPPMARNRVVIFQDSREVTDRLIQYLREADLEPMVQNSGTGALETVLQSRPVLVIVDTHLPGPNGWDILAQLKAHPDTQAIPVILTSVADERVRGLAMGAADYLVQPFSQEQVRSVLKSLSPFSQPEQPPSLSPSPAPDTPPPLVLLVEDNEANRCSIGGYLQAKGYRTEMAHDGYQAIDQVQKLHPDIILMDIQMPGLDGLQATQQIRTLPEGAKVPIIALTALAMPRDRNLCLAAGANAYLAKPVKLKELVTTIDAFIRGDFHAGS